MNCRIALLLVAFPATIAAQVGHHPANSPYRDIPKAMRLGPFAGWYSPANDQAGVFPRSGPMVGARLDVSVGGPADVVFRVAGVPTERDVIDPTRPAGERIVGKKDLSLVMADLGIAFNLTGQRSWHHIVPAVNVSVGLISDFQSRDAGGYRHGTTFALGYGLGVRLIPSQQRLTLRADVDSHFYSTQYPNSYFTGAAEGTSVVPSSASGAKWRNNWSLTLGAAYQLFR